MISVAEADHLIAEHARPSAAVRVPLAEAAGRVLREAVAADRDVPPFDRVAMDGIAVASADLGRASFRIASTQAAGEAPHALTEAGACVEIMTGAALPAGCDTVIRYEDLEMADGRATLRVGVAVRPGQNVHGRGSDRQAGEAVLAPGVLLGPPHVAALATLGRAAVRVSAVPRVALVTTGDEVVAVDAPVLPHQIRQSNGPMLRAALLGDVALEHVRDDAAQLHARLGAALQGCDVLVVVGGVSAGKFDLVPEALARLGVRTVFHRVAQKPGRPLWFGVTDDGRPVFGLPGNPVSALVCLVRYVRPLLDALAGRAAAPQTRVEMRPVPTVTNGLTHFVPVRLDGCAAHAVASNGSGDVLALLPTDGVAEVAPGAAGPLPFFPWTPA